jgi:membrane-bound serine protease (ClpP class)
VSEIAQEPAVVLLAVILAAVLLVGEFALPTLGIAGTAAAGLVVLAGVGISEAELEWWPLSLAIIAIVLWCVMIARRRTSVIQQGVAVGVFTGGSLGFGVIEGDITTIVLALISAAGLAVGFPALFDRAVRLYDAPSSVGMDSHVGRLATVSAWEGTTGSVVLDGSFWNAEGPAGVAEGDEVLVTGYEGMRFTVRRPAPEGEGKPMSVPTREVR